MGSWVRRVPSEAPTAPRSVPIYNPQPVLLEREPPPSGWKGGRKLLAIVAMAGGAAVAFASRTIAHDMNRASSRPTGNWPVVS